MLSLLLTNSPFALIKANCSFVCILARLLRPDSEHILHYMRTLHFLYFATVVNVMAINVNCNVFVTECLLTFEYS